MARQMRPRGEVMDSEEEGLTPGGLVGLVGPGLEPQKRLRKMAVRVVRRARRVSRCAGWRRYSYGSS